MKYTGVFATAEEIDTIKHAANMPMIRIAGRWPKSPQEVVHELALKHGLPEITGMYGCDLRTGEFLTAEDGDNNE